MKFKLSFCYCYSNMWNEAPAIGTLQWLKNIMWTSIKCRTEHEKNEVYQIVLQMYYNDDHVMLLQFWGQSYLHIKD